MDSERHSDKQRTLPTIAGLFFLFLLSLFMMLVVE